MQLQSEKIKVLSQLIFKSPTLPICQKHKDQLNMQYQCENICLTSSCQMYLQSFCSNCFHQKNHLHQIKKIVPQLSGVLMQKWEEIRKQNFAIENEWRTCQVNIKYCIDILNEVQKMISESKTTRLHELPVFENILDSVIEMYGEDRGRNIEQIREKLEMLNKKYGLFQAIDGKNGIDSDCINSDMLFRKQKWLKMGQKTKKFSEKALAFSETLAQSIQDKIKYQKRKIKIDQMTENKTATLKDLFQLYNKNLEDDSFTSKIEELSSLKIELPSNISNSRSGDSSSILKSKQQDATVLLSNNLQKCENLTSVLINNRNGKISPHLWQVVVDKFQFLRKLKQLRLNIRAEDLPFLTKIFKDKHNAVRHIPTLYLTITDEPKLDMKQVAEFCNTLELKSLYLTLTRDNITKSNFVQFTNVLRFRTSLSYLPLSVFQLQLNKNKIIDQMDIIFCENLFNNKYKEIKKKSIAL